MPFNQILPYQSSCLNFSAQGTMHCMHSTTLLHCTTMHSNALNCIALNRTVLNCIAMYCSALQYITLYCNALHDTALKLNCTSSCHGQHTHHFFDRSLTTISVFLQLFTCLQSTRILICLLVLVDWNISVWFPGKLATIQQKWSLSLCGSRICDQF